MTEHKTPRSRVDAARSTPPSSRREATPLSSRGLHHTTEAAPTSTRDTAHPSSRSPTSTGTTPRPPEVRSPASSRFGSSAPPTSARTGTGTLRTDEAAHMHRRVAEVEAELHDAEARVAKANAASAVADEMVGQMLARLAAVQKDLADATARAEGAEAQLARLRAEQGKLVERVHAAETTLDDERSTVARLRAELAEAQQAAPSAVSDELRAEVESLRAEAESLQTKLKREQEERESLRMRVAEFATVCSERDEAMGRLEAIEGELEALKAKGASQATTIKPPPNEDFELLQMERDELAVEAERLRSELSSARAAIEGAADLLAAAHGVLDRAGSGPDLPRKPIGTRKPESRRPESRKPDGQISDDDPTELFKLSRSLFKKE